MHKCRVVVILDDFDLSTAHIAEHDRHFTFNDDAATPHAECLRRVAQSRAWHEPKESIDR